MQHVLDYSSGGRINGHLEIWKIFPDGGEELHYSDSNVITSGMGYTLKALFASDGNENLVNYQLPYFQLGVSGDASLQVSSNGLLGSSLNISQYGDANFMVETHDALASGTVYSGVDFGVIPFSYIKKISPTRVMYSIFIGEDACDGYHINEIGLFSKNPSLATPTKQSMLCAYRYFGGVTKNQSFSVLFRWTIEF